MAQLVPRHLLCNTILLLMGLDMFWENCTSSSYKGHGVCSNSLIKNIWICLAVLYLYFAVTVCINIRRTLHACVKSHLLVLGVLTVVIYMVLQQWQLLYLSLFFFFFSFFIGMLSNQVWKSWNKWALLHPAKQGHSVMQSVSWTRYRLLSEDFSISQEALIHFLLWATVGCSWNHNYMDRVT